MRAWRNWTTQQSTSQRQCITPNAYCCLELNAHGLVLAARRCRDRRRPEQFLVKRFGSQAVEDTFRTLRSMTSMWHTQTNVSLKELGDRMRRVQMIHIVKYRNKGTFRFPKRGPCSGTETCTSNLPSDEMIRAAIEGARISAAGVLERLGIPQDLQSFKCSVIATGDPNWQDCLGDDDDDEDDDTDQNDADDDDHDTCPRVFEADKLFINFTGNIKLRDSKTEKGTYLVKQEGRIYRVSKSQVIWMLTDGRYRGTSARTVRYREKPVSKVIAMGRVSKPARCR